MNKKHIKVLVSVMLILSVNFPLTGFGQLTPKQKQWNEIQVLVSRANDIMAEEKQLQGEAYRAKARQRIYAFREAAVSLNYWIETYYPDGPENPTAGFVHAYFLLALYLEYECAFEYAQRFYKNAYYEFLPKLNDRNIPFPSYAGIRIDKWLEKKLPFCERVIRELKNSYKELYEFNILQSAESEMDKIIKRFNYMAGVLTFRDMISNNSDELFTIKQLAINVADSAAANDIHEWSTIYFEGLSRSYKLPFKKDSLLESAHIWSINDSAGNYKVIADTIQVIDSLLRRTYTAGNPLQKISIAIHAGGTSTSVSDTVFNTLFGRKDDFEEIEYVGVEKWDKRIVLFTTPVNSVKSDVIPTITRTVCINWILTQLSSHPPQWSIGMLNMLLDMARHKTKPSADLLKPLLINKKFPSVEEFIEPGEASILRDWDPRMEYASAFWYYLRFKGIDTVVYNKLQSAKETWDASTSVKELEIISGMSIGKMNKDFQDYCKKTW